MSKSQMVEKFIQDLARLLSFMLIFRVIFKDEISFDTISMLQIWCLTLGK